MANPEDIARAKKGKIIWNVWGKAHPEDAVDFSKATLDGIDFADFVFRGRADFEGTIFQEDVSFENTTFLGIAVFEEATFEKTTLFEGATFRENAEFKGAKFEKSTIFENAKFVKSAIFENVKFHNAGVFKSARFENDTDFSGSAFQRDASFENVAFLGITNFRGVKFEGGAHFRDTAFRDNTNFDDTTFSKNANFGNVKFQSATDFSGATFQSSANFLAATFSKIAKFIGASFHGHINFVSTTFQGRTDFEDATSKSLVNFSNADFTKLTSFKNFTFATVPTFHGAQLHEGTSFEAVAWPECAHQAQSTYDAASAWGRLRVEMSRLHRYEDELFFFARELDVRARDSSNAPRAKRLTCKIYLALGAGRSVAKPLGWLLGLNVALFLPINWYAASAIQWRKLPLRDVLADIVIFNIPTDAVSLTLGQALPFLGGLNPERADLYRRLFASGNRTNIDIPLWLEFVGTFQQLVGIGLLFMIGLALRNRFRMK